VVRKLSGVLIGTAGVYYVASELATRGFHAAVTYGNAPTVDILVGRLDGAATLSLQVKTSHLALRTRGRGAAKSPHHYEWDVGEKSATLHRPDLFFAFVDLKTGSNEKPDVFIIPSKVVFEAFDNPYFKSDKPKRWRWHPGIKNVESFKNNWKILDTFLREKTGES
jgi:hypothetical protein